MWSPPHLMGFTRGEVNFGVLMVTLHGPLQERNKHLLGSSVERTWGLEAEHRGRVREKETRVLVTYNPDMRHH